MTIDQLLWFFYLIFMIVALGPNITFIFWIRRSFASDRDTAPFLLRTILWINNRIVLPAVALALIVWVSMVYFSGQPLTIPWILLTIVFWIAVFILSLLGYRSTIGNQINLAERTGSGSDEYKDATWRSTLIGIAISVITFLIILLLAFQPALWG
ncbi:MAG: hypothetical protein JSV42_11365 [Chloroflexota bacterium]|nr:MAG: hypothetical protein JSV42_11365 [Chloroflexota bacterium]